MSLDEFDRRVQEAMRPFLFKKVTPNLIERVRVTLLPIVEQALAESPARAKAAPKP